MEHRNMIEIICYTGGTCGDLITALVDSTTAQFTDTTVMLDAERTRLKKPHTFASDKDKDQYIVDMSRKYQSIPSHDLDYHIRQAHQFIGITVTNWDVALWAATRFKKVHRPHVWAEMTAVCGADTIEDYAQVMLDFSKLIVQHTDRIVTLESICDGTVLQNPLLPSTNNTFYQNWLQLQNHTR